MKNEGRDRAGRAGRADRAGQASKVTTTDKAAGVITATPAFTVLYAGLEVPTPDALAEMTGTPVVAGPRDLAPHIEWTRQRDIPLVVIPAGTDRDLTSVTQAAQALQWARRSGARVALGSSLIDATRAIAELRRHLRGARGRDAVLFLAHTVDPFADAELLRRVRLAREFSEDIEVEVAFEGSWPSPDAARDRLRRLGAESIAVVRADLAVTYAGTQAGPHAVTHTVDPQVVDTDTPGSAPALPLFRPASLVTAVERASRTALHLLVDHHDDGIAAGLLADHATGFAHSHGEDDGHSHSHGHSHGDGHSHAHSHHHSDPHPSAPHHH